jgi:hypothetical protein
VLSNPDGAAGFVHDVAGGLESAARSLASFLNGL